MEPKYKVGDTVKIKQLSVEVEYDHRFGINSNMVKQAGRTFKIKSIEPTACSEGKIPDDGYRYKLEGICWSWASSMFEDSSEPLSLETSIDNNLDAFIAKKKCPKLDFTL